MPIFKKSPQFIGQFNFKWLNWILAKVSITLEAANIMF